jgi:hypothetical protein
VPARLRTGVEGQCNARATILKSLNYNVLVV